MAFYDLSKQERAKLVNAIQSEILRDLKSGTRKKIILRFSDADTYIQKAAWLSVGRIHTAEKNLRDDIVTILYELLSHADFRVRQTAINSAGEIGKTDFATVQHIFDKGLFDEHHSPRNAVIGSIKKMGEVNPKPVLRWARKYLHHPDKEIRREICHGIELRGRKHPEDILPSLQELEYDDTARVRKTLLHVIGQISYKEGCLKTVVSHLKTWKNKQLIEEAFREIVDVHHRYKDFAVLSPEEAKQYLDENYFKRR